jgi:DNA repair protein RadC
MNTQLLALLIPVIGKRAANTLLAKLQELGNPSYLLKILSGEEFALYIGEKAAKKLSAALQLGRSLNTTALDWKTADSPNRAYELLMPYVRPRQECALAIYLDVKQQVLGIKTLNIGNTDETLIDMKEMLRWAITFNASRIIFAHNHPTGNTEPSYEDMQVTHKMIEACALMNIDLVDSLVLGDGSFASLKKLCPQYWS